MNFNDFLRALEEWLQKINNLDNTESIILDNKYFSFNEKTKTYTINIENL